MLLSSHTSKARRAPTAPRSRPVRRSFHLSLEPLEDRRLLAAGTLLPGDAEPGHALGNQANPVIAWGQDSYLAVWTDDQSALAPLTPSSGPYFGTGLGNMADIYAARLAADGTLIDTTPILVSQEPYYQSRPLVAWNGQTWLVVWASERADNYYREDIVAARVAPDGTVLDPAPILVRAADSMDPLPLGAVASDGDGWTVTWSAWDAGLRRIIYGARVAADGTVLDPAGRALHSGTQTSYPNDARLAFAEGHYLLTWTEYTGSRLALRGRRLTPDLDPAGGIFTLNAAVPGEPHRPQLAGNGAGFFVAWADGSSARNLIGMRATADGEVLDPQGIRMAVTAVQQQITPALTWDGANWVLA